MDLRARLDRYEVTVVPARRTPLTLVWNEPDGAADPASVGAGGQGAVLTILDDYRITRIPGRIAS